MKIERAPTIMVTPHLGIEPASELSTLLKDFSRRRYERNLAVMDKLNEVARTFLTTPASLTIAQAARLHAYEEFYNYYATLDAFYRERVGGLDSSMDVPTELEGIQGISLQRMVQETEDFSTMTSILAETLTQTTASRILFLSPSHAITTSEIKALKQLSNKQIAVLAFDRHADVQKDPSKPQAIGKATVFRSLLEEGDITGVSIVGVENDVYDAIVKGDVSPDDPSYSTHTYFLNHSNTISILGIPTLPNSNSVDRRQFTHDLQAQVAFLHTTGAEALFISLDVDVLRTAFMGYTPMQYSALSDVFPLGIVNFSSLDQVPADIHTLLHVVDTITQTLLEPSSSPQLLPARLAQYKRGELDSLIYKSASYGEGLPLGAIGIALDVIKNECQRVGMDFGVRILGDEKIVFGDIAETGAGPDQQGRMARAIAGYAERIGTQ